MTRTLILIFGLLISACVAQEATPRDPAEHAWQIINLAFKDSNPDKRKQIVQAASLAAPGQK
ncbi:MAG TPA: hypothetical protein VF493_11040, partial [Terriglobales bacterium]